MSELPIVARLKGRFVLKPPKAALENPQSLMNVQWEPDTDLDKAADLIEKLTEALEGLSERFLDIAEQHVWYADRDPAYKKACAALELAREA